MKLTEKILGFIILIGLTLKVFYIPGANMLLVAGTFLLANFYLVFSFLLLNNVPLTKMASKGAFAHTNSAHIIGSIITGFTLMLAIIGITFRIMHWPGSLPMLLASVPPSLIIALICFAKLRGYARTFYIGILIRLAIFGIPALIFTVLGFAGYGEGIRG
ncbi:hypothetical protein ACLI1A_03965 [Flavobacterium sp. RHBU_3]|uniref:hypothetical protein n=1 Tax=Flavobacterium sp. RHBU_3 TaxID=3391184 RepID=UPI0039856B51